MPEGKNEEDELQEIVRAVANLPEEQRREVIEAAKAVAEVRQVTAEYYSGPIPPAKEMIPLEKASPGAIKGIIRLAREVVENNRIAIQGQIDIEKEKGRLALVAQLSVIAVALYALYLDREEIWLPLSLGLSPLLAYLIMRFFPRPDE